MSEPTLSYEFVKRRKFQHSLELIFPDKNVLFRSLQQTLFVNFCILTVGKADILIMDSQYNGKVFFRSHAKAMQVKLAFTQKAIDLNDATVKFLPDSFRQHWFKV